MRRIYLLFLLCRCTTVSIHTTLSFCLRSSIPSTLTFCPALSELYLDHNLLDALPGFLLRMSELDVVHRHGNHNYFKSTFMWYHTDVNNRILEDPGQQQQPEPTEEDEPLFPRDSLQECVARAVLAARIDFYQVRQLPISCNISS